MKKTILASAILLVAGGANAAEVYNNEGATVTLGGSFRGNVVIEDSDDIKFKDAGSRFDIQATKDLGDGVTVLGAAEIQQDASELFLEKSYVGLEHDIYGTATIGKQYGLNDDIFLYDFSYKHGNIYQESNVAFGNAAIDQFKYVNSYEGATIVVSLMDQDTYAIGGTYEVAGLTLAATYNMKNDVELMNKKFDNSNYVVSASYSIDALTVAASYTASDIFNIDVTAYGLGAKYAMGQAGVYVMYDKSDIDQTNQDYSEIVIGADYELAEGVIAYAEFGSRDISDNGFISIEDQKALADTGEVLYIGGRFYF